MGRIKGDPNKLKISVTVTINREVWRDAGPILQEMGLSRSLFIEQILRAFLDSQTKTMQETYENLLTGILREVTRTDVKEKKSRRAKPNP